jgi:hypothetical protein
LVIAGRLIGRHGLETCTAVAVLRVVFAH